MQIPTLKSIPMALLASVAVWGFAGCEKKSDVGPKVKSEDRSATAEKTPPASGLSDVVPGSNPSVVPVPPEPTVGKVDFASEAERILGLPEGAERDAVLGGFVRQSMHDGGFERTEEWIRKLPAGATRDTAYTSFIEDLANVAPMRALGDVSQIANPSLRASLEAKIRSSPAFNQSSLRGPAAQGANAPIPAEAPTGTDP